MNPDAKVIINLDDYKELEKAANKNTNHFKICAETYASIVEQMVTRYRAGRISVDRVMDILEQQILYDWYV